MGNKLASEIRQTRPFGSLEEEASLNVQKTAACFEQALAEALKPHGLSPTQYNALRILRGAGAKGLACQEIGARMIRPDPDITRLLDRLEARGLVRRERSEEDRRVVLGRIAEAGTKLLASLDRVVADLHRKVLGGLGDRKLRLMIDLLEESRGR